MDRAARNRWFMRAASVVFAFMLWYFVTWDSTGTEKRKYLVPLDYGDVPEGYSISRTSLNVEVDLEGKPEAFAFLSIGSVRASVEMSSWRPGKYSLPIQLTPPGGFRVAGYSPNIVEFEVFRTIERTFRPVLVLTDDVPNGLTLVSVDMVPTEVVVKGPEAAVMALRRAETRGAAREMTEGTREMAVVLTDENGDVSGSDLDIEPPVVRVTAGFSRALQEARVPVRVEITGEPPEGLEVSGVVVSPDHVTLRGTREALLGVTEIALNPIDVSGHTESMNIDIPLEAPSDAVTISGSPHVLVRVELRDAVETGTYMNVPVALEGVADTDMWSVSPGSANVVVERPASAPFPPEEPPLELYIDATNVVASQITLPIMTRNAAEGVSVIRIEPSQATITALTK